MRQICIFFRFVILIGLVGGALSATAAPPEPAVRGASPVAQEPTANVLGSSADAVAKFLQDSGVLAAVDVNIGAGQLMQQVRVTASDLVMSAMNFLGVPYRRGGTSADTGFDCSGFTRHVFENSIGLLLPRRSRDQAQVPGLLTVKRDELKPGDLVFFNTMRSAFSHVGIYVGEGKFIHSPRSGSQVRVEDMREAYWTKRFNGARRAPDSEGSATLSASLRGMAMPGTTLSSDELVQPKR